MQTGPTAALMPATSSASSSGQSPEPDSAGAVGFVGCHRALMVGQALRTYSAGHQDLWCALSPRFPHAPGPKSAPVRPEHAGPLAAPELHHRGNGLHQLGSTRLEILDCRPRLPGQNFVSMLQGRRANARSTHWPLRRPSSPCLACASGQSRHPAVTRVTSGAPSRSGGGPAGWPSIFRDNFTTPHGFTRKRMRYSRAKAIVSGTDPRQDRQIRQQFDGAAVCTMGPSAPPSQALPPQINCSLRVGQPLRVTAYWPVLLEGGLLGRAAASIGHRPAYPAAQAGGQQRAVGEV